MSNSEHATMNAVETTRLNAAEPAPLMDPGRVELGHGDHAVLACGQASNDGVRIVVGALPTHGGGLSANPPESPPFIAGFRPGPTRT
jgi:hypothetical protein